MLLGAKPFAAENAQGMYMAHLYEPPKSLRLVAPQLDVDVRADDLSELDAKDQLNDLRAQGLFC